MHHSWNCGIPLTRFDDVHFLEPFDRSSPSILCWQRMLPDILADDVITVIWKHLRPSRGSVVVLIVDLVVQRQRRVAPGHFGNFIAGRQYFLCRRSLHCLARVRRAHLGSLAR